MKFVFREKRAQAAAPFELFVAVTIMAFVMIIGYMVLDSATTQSCLNNVDNEMRIFKSNLEEAANKRSSSSFLFSPDTKCFASKEAKLWIHLEKNSRICTSACGKPLDECYIFSFTNSAIPNSSRSKCLDLPSLTTLLPGIGSTSCELAADASLASYTPVDPTNNTSKLPTGNYVIRNVASAAEQYAKICIWHKS